MCVCVFILFSARKASACVGNGKTVGESFISPIAEKANKLGEPVIRLRTISVRERFKLQLKHFQT